MEVPICKPGNYSNESRVCNQIQYNQLILVFILQLHYVEYK